MAILDIVRDTAKPNTLRFPNFSPWLIVSTLVTIFILIPIAILTVEIIRPDLELWEHMLNTFLPKAVVNTLWLVGGVGVGTLVLGTGFAWLVTAYDFPGRRWFEQLLLLPLAIPTFVMGFVFLGLFEFAGPIQTQWRAWFGAEAWFPDVYSRGGVIVVMTLVLYPYVYILARAAFKEQASSTLEAAQIMGYGRMTAFFRLALPLARPSIAAGTILAMLEALTDFGVVQFFDYPTLSERVVILWNRSYDYAQSTQLAVLLLIVALGIIGLERLLRGRARYYQHRDKGGTMRRQRLTGWKRWTAFGACGAMVSAAFFIPVTQLILWVLDEVRNPSLGDAWRHVYMDYVGNSVLLASVGAGVVIALALLIAYGVRRSALTEGRRVVRLLSRFVTLGYAMPGAVIAIGVLMVVNPIDADLTQLAETLGRTNPNFILTGTIMALTYAYIVRFMAVGFNSVESSMEKVKPSMEEAARCLGAKPWRVLTRIHAPLVSAGMAAGAILVFVDIMKELPATLLLRPFAMDTLALWTYFLAMESFWEAAAIPSLTIVAIGLIPVFILMRIGHHA